MSIKKEDVDLIVSTLPTCSDLRNLYRSKDLRLSFFQMKEMEISRILAEQTLREHRGDIVEALITLTN